MGTEKKGLIYVNDSFPGYGRRKHARGFIYFDEKQIKLTDKAELKRLKELRIPPAWKKVWICKSPHGYLQATGYDDRERKQYLYHTEWSEFSLYEKFGKLLDFGKALPGIRQEIEKNLQRPAWDRIKVLSLVLKLMDEKHMRVGNKAYERENETYGVTTIRRKHLKETGNRLLIQFRGKSGKQRSISINDEQLKKLVKESSELPGYEIFRFIDEKGDSNTVDSADVNAFLQQISRQDFTSKTFRTWGGTVLAVEEWQEAKRIVQKDSRKKLKTTIVREVARKLGNTISVAEQYYIHPYVLKKLSDKEFKHNMAGDEHFSSKQKQYLDKAERLTLYLLEKEQDAPAK